MTTAAQVRKGAQDLPSTSEQTRNGQRSYQVAGKVFAWVSSDRKSVFLRLPAEAARQVRSDYPTAELSNDRGAPVRLPLRDVNGMVLNNLLAQAWCHQAPRELRDRFDAAMTGESTDLPAIGKPATRALLAAGISTLEEVAARSEAEICAMHGVGPVAVRILREALAESGRTFA